MTSVNNCNVFPDDLKMSLEYSTLGKCASQLESAMTSDIHGIAQYLFNTGFISDELFKEVTDSNSVYSSANKASKLVLHIMRKVKLYPKSFFKFINFLRLRSNYHTIVDVLDAEYFGITKLPGSAQPSGQRGKIVDCM